MRNKIYGMKRNKEVKCLHGGGKNKPSKLALQKKKKSKVLLQMFLKY
jgi:galactose mutarotase-like enzyme